MGLSVLLSGPRVAWLCALATVDLLAGSREDPPRGAELVDTLARRLAGLPVGDEVVERVTVVGDLELAVLPLGGAEQGGAHAVSGDRLPLRDERRPEGGAGAVAGALRALVLDEVVEGDSLAVDQDAAERRLRDHDCCAASAYARRERLASHRRGGDDCEHGRS